MARAIYKVLLLKCSVHMFGISYQGMQVCSKQFRRKGVATWLAGEYYTSIFWDHVHTLQKAFLPVNTKTIITQNQDPGPLNTTQIYPHKVCVFVPPPQNYFDHVYHTTYWQNCTVKSNLVNHILYSFSCFCRAVLTNFSVGLQMVPYAFHTYVLKCSL